MATTTPPQSQSQTPSQEQLRQAQYNNLVTYTSLAALILCPALIALPPRKFDLYTILLISGTALGANQVLRAHTGRGITERLPALQRPSPPRAAEIQERASEDRPRRDVGNEIAGERAPDAGAVARAVREMKAAEAVRLSRDVETGEGAPRRGKADWKAVRDAREKEALEDGRGYGGLIVDQIWEVWNWGRGTGEVGKGDKEGMVVEGEDGRK